MKFIALINTQTPLNYPDLCSLLCQVLGVLKILLINLRGLSNIWHSAMLTAYVPFHPDSRDNTQWPKIVLLSFHKIVWMKLDITRGQYQDIATFIQQKTYDTGGQYQDTKLILYFIRFCKSMLLYQHSTVQFKQ